MGWRGDGGGAGGASVVQIKKEKRERKIEKHREKKKTKVRHVSFVTLRQHDVSPIACVFFLSYRFFFLSPFFLFSLVVAAI